MIRQVSKNHLIYAMAPNNVPVLHVQSGDTLVFETCDCFENQILPDAKDFGGVDWDRINPATGPVYIEGAHPGDILAVHIRTIEVAESGVMTTGPGLGVLGDTLTENVILHVPIEDGHYSLGEGLRFPLEPMIGVIGTAPEGESISCGTPGRHGGNMDCKRITAGATLLLPVAVEGALLAMGDLHAGMADGEAAVCGVEVSGSVTVEVEVLHGVAWPVPMLINADTIMTIASEETLDEAVTSAVKAMVELMEATCGLSSAQAVFVVSAKGDVRVCQVVDPKKTARVELSREILENNGWALKAHV